MSNNRILMRVLLIASLYLGLAASAAAVDRTWDGGSATWDAVGSKWDPNGVPVNGDNVILETPDDVVMGINAVVDDITLEGGIDLDTQGFVLAGDHLTISGVGSDLVVDPRAIIPASPALDVDAATINSGGRITLFGSAFELDGTTGTGLLDINVGGTLRGYGHIQLDDLPASATTLMALDGTLTVGDIGNVLGNPAARTLIITQASTNARVDLDGTGGGGDGIVNVNRNATLTIAVDLSDQFDGTMNLGANATISLNSWANGGVINVNSGASSFPPLPAAPAHIGGATWTNYNRIILSDTDEALVFDAPFQQSGSTGITNNGSIIFNANANIFPGTDFTMGSVATVTVNSGKFVSISADDFDLDPFNTLTIGSGGTLMMNSGADGVLNGVTNLNGGTWQVNGSWTLGGTVQVGAGTGASQIAGGTVNVGASIVVGANSTLSVNSPSTWNPSNTTVQAGATLTIAGPITYQLGAGTMTGPGTVIQANNATVTGQTIIAVDTYKWDGGATTINSGVPFFLTVGHIDTGGSDTHNHTINVNNGALNVVVADGEWELGVNGDLNLNDSGSSPGPVLNGSRLRVLSAGRIDVDGNAFILAPVVLEEGAPLTLHDEGVLEISGPLTLAGGDLLDDVNRLTNDTQITLAGGLTVTGASTVDVERFNWDESGTTIETFGALTVLADYLEAPGDPQRYDSTIVNHGVLTVDLGVHTTWIMDGALQLSKNSLVQPSLSGDVVDVGDDLDLNSASLVVTGSGQSNINSKIRFYSDANVNIATGAFLSTKDFVFFDSVNGANNATFTGGGTWLFGSEVFFEEPTTINMPAGAVDLDGGPTDADGDLIRVNVPVVMNLGALHDFGNPSGNNNISIEDAARLTVNLTNADEWTITSKGSVTYDGDATNGIFLDGADVNINGFLRVRGHGQTNARIDVGGMGAQVTMDSDDELTLNGGSLLDPNTINGGLIGNGILRLTAGRALTGWGVIGSTVDGPGSAEMRADNGVLNVTGAISDLNFLGTADNDGVLLMLHAWNTNVVAAVDLKGGTLTGGVITNDGVIQGFGLVGASQLVNNGRVAAEYGGALVLDRDGVPTGYDWDGVSGSGVLEAVNGNLALRAGVNEAFAGAINIGAGREFFVDGFQLQHGGSSEINFAGGVYKANTPQLFGGAIDVNANAEIDALGTFAAGGATNLDAALQLRQSMTVAAGAVLSGGGKLVNLNGATLTVANGASIGVTLDNQGTLVLGASPGQASVAAFVQTSTGTWALEVGGAGATQYDRLTLTGAATLAGTLDLATINGYVPAFGHTFDILSAPGGVTGAFSAVEQPANMPAGLLFDVVYSPMLVQLVVVNEPVFAADFNGDGSVNGADLTQWQGDFGVNADSDSDDDGDTDGADFLTWQQQLGSGRLVNATSASVPEPRTTALLVAAIFAGSLRRRRLWS